MYLLIEDADLAHLRTSSCPATSIKSMPTWPSSFLHQTRLVQAMCVGQCAVTLLASTDVGHLFLLFQVQMDPPQELLDAGADVLASQNRSWGDSGGSDRATFSKVTSAGWVGGGEVRERR